MVMHGTFVNSGNVIWEHMDSLLRNLQDPALPFDDIGLLLLQWFDNVVLVLSFWFSHNFRPSSQQCLHVFSQPLSTRIELT
ncbi:hypothetical protein PILCRDRAFT_248375 [Piloderma croceum F 1598]|uniref:Uncharacterized protein n=1 Tax=Piloderma croceum (strain F 1598) TaxID=765440 RepID=A0A0C3BNT9_PILCF|nr:hypothetical protein PILCRDRAFT_248375 [Piloderma croceum F 1598]